MKHHLAWLIVCLLACLQAWPAFAASRAALRKQVEASMVVTGTILIETDGRVNSYAIDHADKLPEVVTGLLARAVPQWKFEPVLADGKPAMAKAKMSLLLVARQSGEDKYQIRIRSANFDGERPSWSLTRMPPPKYPVAEFYDRVSGTVYLVLRIRPDGHVQDAIAEQVNLRAFASESRMKKWREAFAKSALRAVRRWVFAPQADAATTRTGYDLLRIPIDYLIGSQTPASYGEWNAYVPGPRQPVPWPEAASLPSPDALGTKGIYSLNQALHLLTPLG